MKKKRKKKEKRKHVHHVLLRALGSSRQKLLRGNFVERSKIHRDDVRDNVAL